MSDEKNNSIKTSDHSIIPDLDYYGTNTRVRFNGSCFRQNSVTFNHRKVLSTYNVYDIK